MVGCFGIELIPTGSEDPYGLRRQAMGLVRILVEKDVRLVLDDCIGDSVDLYGSKLSADKAKLVETIWVFLQERLRKLLTDAGYRPDTIQSVLKAGAYDPAQMTKKLEAIKQFQTDPRFGILITAYKRAFNITVGWSATDVRDSIFENKAEAELYQTYNRIEPRFTSLLAEERYGDALELLLEFAEPIDVFFEQVMVMADDENLRANRKSLLRNITYLFLRLADFSEMEEAP
jgi:glycyl-tRNA synthetase beta chain